MVKTLTQYLTRCRRDVPWPTIVVDNIEVMVHPGFDAWDIDYDENGNWIPEGSRRNPEKDREPKL